jgi:hypothetical protein
MDQGLLHNFLHNPDPPQTNDHDFIRPSEGYPVEKTWYAGGMFVS